MQSMFGSREAVETQKSTGIQGSRKKHRKPMVDALTNGGSSAAEGVDAQHMRIVHAMSHMLMDEYTDRLLGDTRWCDAYAAAAVAVARASRAGRCARIMVFGLGSMVPALAAARAPRRSRSVAGLPPPRRAWLRGPRRRRRTRGGGPRRRRG